MINDREPRKNLEEFWETHGAIGFLKLYLSKYLHNIVMSQIRAKPEQNFDDMGKDFHLKDGKALDWEKSQEYQNEIYEECKAVANRFVEDLEKNETFSSILEKGDIGRFIEEKKKLFEIFEKSFHKFIQKFGEEHEKG